MHVQTSVSSILYSVRRQPDGFGGPLTFQEVYVVDYILISEYWHFRHLWHGALVVFASTVGVGGVEYPDAVSELSSYFSFFGTRTFSEPSGYFYRRWSWTRAIFRLRISWARIRLTQWPLVALVARVALVFTEEFMHFRNSFCLHNWFSNW